VYWQKGARQKLQSLHPSRFLHDQLRDAFAVTDTPIWQDSSTTKQCQELENAVGGPEVCMDISTVAELQLYKVPVILRLYLQKKRN
jgi:xylulokinase